MPGRMDASIKRPAVYRALRRRGLSKTSAARISNAQAAGTIDRRGKKRKR